MIRSLRQKLFSDTSQLDRTLLWKVCGLLMNEETPSLVLKEIEKLNISNYWEEQMGEVLHCVRCKTPEYGNPINSCGRGAKGDTLEFWHNRSGEAPPPLPDHEPKSVEMGAKQWSDCVYFCLLNIEHQVPNVPLLLSWINMEMDYMNLQ